MFVGVKAYKAPGGTITHDLVSADDEGFMDDAALVRRLAVAKLEAKAEELRPEWTWTKVVLEPEYRFLAQHARLQPKPGSSRPNSTRNSNASSNASANSKASMETDSLIN